MELKRRPRCARNLALSRPIQFDQHYTLPRAQQQFLSNGSETDVPISAAIM